MSEYDQFAQAYAEGTEDLEGKTRIHFYSLLTQLKEKIILDVGCGSGHDAQYYASKGANVHGLDISQKEIEMAQKRNCGVFTRAPMEDIPYDTNTFDIVTSFYAIQHTESMTRTISEMIRVAKAGGSILILAKHPFRNLLESHVNDGNSDYYLKRNVTSYIFNKTIKLTEQGHTMMDYLNPSVLSMADLEFFEEHTDFPASDQVIPGLIYPTYMILKYRKRQ